MFEAIVLVLAPDNNNSISVDESYGIHYSCTIFNLPHPYTFCSLPQRINSITICSLPQRNHFDY